MDGRLLTSGNRPAASSPSSAHQRCKSPTQTRDYDPYKGQADAATLGRRRKTWLTRLPRCQLRTEAVNKRAGRVRTAASVGEAMG